jgi:hypothetical protein
MGRHYITCPLKSQCCPKAPFRRIPRSIYEEARGVARALAKTVRGRKTEFCDGHKATYHRQNALCACRAAEWLRPRLGDRFVHALRTLK